MFRDISELKNLMTDEQKKKSDEDFKKFYPPGTPEIMCTSKDSVPLTYVNLDDFDDYKYVECTCPFTGTIEYMKVKNED